ncbi:MAG: hypothetical protein MK101_04320 [Phycisphaerales bacterium]|nr:hypothetical protein [Phycisphaerales bacterium]
MFLMALAAVLSLSLQESQTPLNIGSNRQVFVDHHLIESLDNVRLELGRPVDAGTVFTFDKPWEGPFSGYSTIIQDADRFLLYYRGLPRAGGDGTDRETTCVAISDDGVNFTRPDLGLHEVDGSFNNNVVLAGVAPVTHNFSPFLDTRPNVPEGQRFKGLGGNEHSGLLAFASPDGIHWSPMQDEPVLTEGMFDSQNVAFWSQAEGKYLCYLRTWTGEGYAGFRSVSRATSDDFINWSAPEEMTFGPGEMEHIYTNQTHPYCRAPDVYVAVAARFMPDRQVLTSDEAQALGVDGKYFGDCSDAVLMTSRGGTTYDRTFREGFLRPGIGLQHWVSRSNYPALNIVQTSPTELSLYVNQHYAQPSAQLRRYTMRVDGLASVRADASGGSLLTKPLLFEGDTLELNFSTSAAGGMQVELLDAAGSVLPGFGIDDCVELIGNEVDRAVTWRGEGDVSALAGSLVRVRFVMRDADLYSFRFTNRSHVAASPPG